MRRYRTLFSCAAFAGIVSLVLPGSAPAAQRDASPGLDGMSLPQLDLPGLPKLDPDAPWSPTAPEGSWFPTRPGESPLQAWIRKRQEVQKPAPGEAVATALDGRVQALDRRCRSAMPGACLERDALQASVGSLRNGLLLAPRCNDSAIAFDPYYASDPSPAIAQAYDLDCLGSFGPRFLAGVEQPNGEMPALIAAGVKDPANGVLAMVGIIEIAGVPFCAGLLRPDRTLVTARHCHTRQRSAIDAGNVTVRSASGRGGPWKLGQVRARPAVDSDAAADDWIVLEVKADADFEVPAPVTKPMPLASEVTLIGHYAYYQHISYPTPLAPVWQRGLRFPRKGLCQAIKRVGECVQLACQTVRGFSGTPVFIESATPGVPQVIGIVSQEHTERSACGSAIAGTTLAVAATSFPE